MNNSTLTLLRGAATAAIAGLTAAIAYYPDQHWIAPVIAALAVYGIHAIPTANQTPPLLPSTSPSIPENTGVITTIPGGYHPANPSKAIPFSGE